MHLIEHGASLNDNSGKRNRKFNSIFNQSSFSFITMIIISKL